jgi:hypothetical protein
MIVQSPKSKQRTFWDTDSVTGSPALLDGQKQSGLQDTNQHPESSVQACHANRFRVAVNSEVRKMNGTCGQNSIASSASVALQQSLANKLAASLDVNGSMEFALTWKSWGMQSGRQICALRASGGRTSGNESTGEPSGWPTPAVQNATGGINPSGNTGEHFTLQTAASLAGWPTPNTLEGRGGLQANPEAAMRRKEQGHQLNLDDVACLAGWGTPRVTTNGGLSNANRGSLKESRLEDQVQGWATPSARDWKDTPGMATTGTNPDGSERERMDQLPRQVHGVIGTQSCAETAKSGGLDPQLPRWLMALPEAWDHCSPNWKEWEWMQSVLKQCGSGQEVAWQKLAKTVLEDFEATETP